MIEIIAEIGINHNGDINLVKKMIDVACVAGCNYVKFQKRTPNISTPEHQKNVIKDTPWGKMTYIDYKHKIELDEKDYDFIDTYCKEKNIKWFASAWDLESVDFLKKYNIPIKIASALITDNELISYARKNTELLMISTGMSTEKQVQQAIKISNPDIIFHTNSSYPSNIEEINLNYIKWLKDKYPNKIIGYSGHEYGLVTTYAAVGLGAEIIERHITLDRLMWGSDQLSSVEPDGLIKLVKGIKDIEKALGNYSEREITKSEFEKLKTLRK